MNDTMPAPVAQIGELAALASGGSGGRVLSRLDAANMDVGILRPFKMPDGRCYATLKDCDPYTGQPKIDAEGKPVLVNRLVANATLRYDEQKFIDDAIVPIARQRMSIVNRLVAAGLVLRIDGMASTVLQYQRRSGMGVAQMAMVAKSRGNQDTFTYDTNYLPLPFTFCDYGFDIRTLRASRKFGNPIDTTGPEEAALVVAEKTEETFASGTYAAGGGTFYGLTTYPSANTYTLSGAWTNSGITGQDIVEDVLSMIQANHDDYHHGPYGMFYPTAYQTVLQRDYSSSKGDNTIMSRLVGPNGIPDLKFADVADFLPANKVVVVELQSRTIRAVIGLEPTPVEWDEEGGLVTNYKLLSIIVPDIRADKNGKTGIVVGSGS